EVIEALGDDVRARIALVRDSLRELQSLLSNAPGASNGHARAAGPAQRGKPHARSARSGSTRNNSARSNSTRSNSTRSNSARNSAARKPAKRVAAKASPARK